MCGGLERQKWNSYDDLLLKRFSGKAEVNYWELNCIGFENWSAVTAGLAAIPWLRSSGESQLEQAH